jgi:hypothetical protein
MAKSGATYTYHHGDLVEVLDEQGNSMGKFRVSRQVNPRTVKVVDQHGIVRPYSIERIRLVERRKTSASA